MKYYAIRKGRKTGIFRTWDECKRYTINFKGAEFKSFKSLETAKKYLKDFRVNQYNIKKGTYDLHIYVDGSYDKKSLRSSYGIIVLNNDMEIVDTISLAFDDRFNSHNVTGEILGAIHALKYAHDRGMSAKIYHDYTGISAWFRGEWKANSEIAQFYVESTKDYKKDFICFVKVKGHTGDTYNEMADKVARQALKLDNELEEIKWT